MSVAQASHQCAICPRISEAGVSPTPSHSFVDLLLDFGVVLLQVLGLPVSVSDYREVNAARDRTQLQFLLDNALWSESKGQFVPGSRVDSVAELAEMLDLTGRFTVSAAIC